MKQSGNMLGETATEIWMLLIVLNQKSAQISGYTHNVYGYYCLVFQQIFLKIHLLKMQDYLRFYIYALYIHLYNLITFSKSFAIKIKNIYQKK